MHTLKNFKSFADTRLNLMQPVTLVIGKNGSGKSNAIEGVELLAQIAHGRPLYEISDVGRGSGTTFQVRGGLPACVHNDNFPQPVNSLSSRIGEVLMRTTLNLASGEFTLGFDEVVIVFGGTTQPVNYIVTIGFSPDPRIKEERLTIGNRVIFQTLPSEGNPVLDVQYDNFARGRNKPVISLPADRSVLSRYAQFAPDRTRKMAVDAILVVEAIESYLKAAYVFDPHPHAMREYERVGQYILNRDGSNLSSVLYGLGQGDEKQKAGQKLILELIRQFPEEPFEDFDFTQTSRGDVLLGLKRSDGAVIDARVLSDGTLRALAILTALETAQTGSRIVLEEVDNGIHPSRAKVLMDHIWATAGQRKLNILATTHNPATLNGLSHEQLKSVVVCHYDSQQQASRLTPLFELPHSEVLLEGRQLGDLITRQVFEQYLMPRFEEDRREKAQAWLDSLV